MAHQRAVGRFLVLATGLAIIVAATLTGQASADPGVSQIGPKPSSNIRGVMCIQRMLGVEQDGDYGDATFHAVMKFQDSDPELRAAGPDGAVGPLTGEKLLKLHSSEQEDCASVLPSKTRFTTQKSPTVKGPAGGDTVTVTKPQATATTCTPHVGNTQAWVDCVGGDAPMWVRLSYVCRIGPEKPSWAHRDQTYTTEWEKVEAHGTHSISKECKEKVRSAKGDMRPF